MAQDRFPIRALPGGCSDALVRGDNAVFPRVGFTSLHEMFRKLVHMVKMDPTEKNLVLGILDAPDDPARRLVYADWLDENERQKEAEEERKAAEELAKPLPEPVSVYGSLWSGGLASGQIGTYTLASGSIMSTVMFSGIIADLPYRENAFPEPGVPPYRENPEYRIDYQGENEPWDPPDTWD